MNRAVDKAATLVDHALVGAAYAYELRLGEEIFSTGRLAVERELAPGDEVTVAGVVAHVEELSWGQRGTADHPPSRAPSTGQLAPEQRSGLCYLDAGSRR